MSYTNSTSNLRLPQWIASDKPNWDIDLNDAFRKIDDFAGEKNTGDAAMSARINENKDSITALQGEVNSVEGEVTVLSGRTTDLEQENDSQQSAIDKLNNDYTALDDTVAGQGTRLTTAESDIDSLEAQTAINTGNIAALQKLDGLEVVELESVHNESGGSGPYNPITYDYDFDFTLPAGKELVSIFEYNLIHESYDADGTPTAQIVGNDVAKRSLSRVMREAFIQPNVDVTVFPGAVFGYYESQQITVPPTTASPTINLLSVISFHNLISAGTVYLKRVGDTGLSFHLSGSTSSTSTIPKTTHRHILKVLVKDA